jgi:hypothetical protein
MPREKILVLFTVGQLFYVEEQNKTFTIKMKISFYPETMLELTMFLCSENPQEGFKMQMNFFILPHLIISWHVKNS